MEGQDVEEQTEEQLPPGGLPPNKPPKTGGGDENEDGDDDDLDAKNLKILVEQIDVLEGQLVAIANTVGRVQDGLFCMEFGRAAVLLNIWLESFMRIRAQIEPLLEDALNELNLAGVGTVRPTVDDQLSWGRDRLQAHVDKTQREAHGEPPDQPSAT